MLNNMIGLSCDHLGGLLNIFESQECETQNILIIDCRSFLAYNDSHIINSINVFYPPFLRRRVNIKPSLQTIISDNLIRDRILSDYYYNVILYEDVDLSKDSIALYIAKCLQDESEIKSINYLEGGFSVFKNQYPLLCSTKCTNNLPNQIYIKSSIVNKPKRSQYIYTWPFKSKSSSSFAPLTPPNNTLISDGFSTLVFEQQSEPAELLPYLFLGSESHAASKNILLKLGITAILNVSHNCPNYFEDLFQYKRIPIKDSKCDDISLMIKEAVDFIDCNIKTKEKFKILVHCRAGISRSATICIAYLIMAKRIRMEEAYEYVKSRRCLISPNFNFMTQLMEFEDKVFTNL